MASADQVSHERLLGMSIVREGSALTDNGYDTGTQHWETEVTTNTTNPRQHCIDSNGEQRTLTKAT